MKDLLRLISFEEQIQLKLRALFERYGYSEYRMGKFESYELYRDNISFLKSNSIITVTDSKGRLMALKPDVTMSIVNSIQPDTGIEKLYYVENVFRRSSVTDEYQEIRQVGIEYIGTDSVYCEFEVVLLALKCLEVISDKYLLDLSHMGYIQGLLIKSGADGDTREKILGAIRQKNRHEVCSICNNAGISQTYTDCMKDMCGISGDFAQALKASRDIVTEAGGSAQMEAAVDELERIYRVVDKMGYGNRIRLDFCAANDLDYYNGILLLGYVEEAPVSILTGGRYDNLMKKWEKEQPAIGFALNLQALMRAFRKPKDFKVDVAVVYGDAPAEDIVTAVERFIGAGKSVRAVKEYEAGIRAKEIYKL